MGIKITGGEGWYKSHNGGYIVPKSELLKPFFKDYGSERFLIADELADREGFIKQVQSFDYEISDSGHVSFGARAGAHDDYIIAVALVMFIATLEPFQFQYFGGSGANQKRLSLMDLKMELKKPS